MKIKKLLFFLVIIITITSCAVRVPKYIQEHFTFCYDGKNTGIDSLINIKGYFVIEEPYDRYMQVPPYTDHKRDTIYTNIMLFEDGTITEFHSVDEEGSGTGQSNIPLYLKEIAQNKSGKKAYWFYNSQYWGRYIIDGNLIKIQNVNLGSSWRPWGAWEVCYKVIDRNTIIQIDTKPIHEMTESDWKNWEINKKKLKYFPAKFVPVEVRPAPDSWLKKEPWFWCKNRK